MTIAMPATRAHRARATGAAVPSSAASSAASRLPPAARGVIVTAVDPSSDAAEEGLQRGDLIMSVNRQPVTTPAQVLEMILSGPLDGRRNLRDELALIQARVQEHADLNAIAWVDWERAAAQARAEELGVSDRVEFRKDFHVGDRFTVFKMGEELIDPDSGAKLGSTEEKIGTAEVVDAQEKFAIVTVTGKPGNGMVLRKSGT